MTRHRNPRADGSTRINGPLDTMLRDDSFENELWAENMLRAETMLLLGLLKHAQTMQTEKPLKPERPT